MASWGKAIWTTLKFTYSDSSGNSGFGNLVTQASGFPNSVWAISGILNLVTSADANFSIGAYPLILVGPAAQVSPSGRFLVDNILYMNNDGPNPPAYMNTNGLLFGQPGTGQVQEINCWGNGGANNYSFYTFFNGNYNIQSNGGTFTLVSEPTPTWSI